MPTGSQSKGWCREALFRLLKSARLRSKYERAVVFGPRRRPAWRLPGAQRYDPAAGTAEFAEAG